MRHLGLATIASFVAAGMLATPALAQRDPAYQAARDAQQVGELPDGYLGIVGTPTPALRKVVDDVNIKRRVLYTSRAQATNSTIEEYALTMGCKAILETKPGEMYRTPGGVWKVRTAELPERDSRCS